MPNRRTQFYPWKNFILDTSFPPPFDLNCKFKLIPIGGRVFNFLSQVPLYPRGGGRYKFHDVTQFPSHLDPNSPEFHSTRIKARLAQGGICHFRFNLFLISREVVALQRCIRIARNLSQSNLSGGRCTRVISVSVFLIRRYFPGRDQTEGVEGIESQFCPWLILV